MKASFRFVSVILVVVFIAWVSVSFFSYDVGQMMRNNAVSRQASRICLGLFKGEFSKEELCSLLPPQIPSLTAYYEKLREQDGKWYAKNGSLYYPKVSCSISMVNIELLGQKFRCKDGEAERIDVEATSTIDS